MTSFVVIWYLVGFPGALLAREAFQHIGFPREPFTYGSLITVILFAFTGPATCMAAVVGWITCLAAYLSDGGMHKWLKRPVFPARR